MTTRANLPPDPRTYEEGRDDPAFAARILCVMLVLANQAGTNPGFSDARMLKARYLLKTLAVAAGIGESTFDGYWLAARGDE